MLIDESEQQSSDFFGFSSLSLDSHELSLETQMKFRLLTDSELTSRIKSLCRRSQNTQILANTFQERFESRFHLREKGFPKKTMLIAKQIFSNLLASIEFHASSSPHSTRSTDRFFVWFGLVLPLLSLLFALLSILRLRSRLCDPLASGMERHAGVLASHFLDLYAGRSNSPGGFRWPQSLSFPVCLIRVVTDRILSSFFLFRVGPINAIAASARAANRAPKRRKRRRRRRRFQIASASPSNRFRFAFSRFVPRRAISRRCERRNVDRLVHIRDPHGFMAASFLRNRRRVDEAPPQSLFVGAEGSESRLAAVAGSWNREGRAFQGSVRCGKSNGGLADRIAGAGDFDPRDRAKSIELLDELLDSEAVVERKSELRRERG